MAHQICLALPRGRLTAKWISRVSGTPAVAVATAVAEAARQLQAVPQLPLAAEQHRQQPRRLEGLAPHRPQPELRQVELRRRVERRQLRAAGAAEGVVVAISPAPPTLMAPSTPDSAKWLATRTACRR